MNTKIRSFVFVVAIALLGGCVTTQPMSPQGARPIVVPQVAPQQIAPQNQLQELRSFCSGFNGNSSGMSQEDTNSVLAACSGLNNVAAVQPVVETPQNPQFTEAWKNDVEATLLASAKRIVANQERIATNKKGIASNTKAIAGLRWRMSRFSDMINFSDDISNDVVRINFGSNSDTLGQSAKRKLRRFIARNKACASVKIRGFASSAGNADENYVLANERALAVRAMLERNDLTAIIKNGGINHGAYALVSCDSTPPSGTP